MLDVALAAGASRMSRCASESPLAGAAGVVDRVDVHGDLRHLAASSSVYGSAAGGLAPDLFRARAVAAAPSRRAQLAHRAGKSLAAGDDDSSRRERAAAMRVREPRALVRLRPAAVCRRSENCAE